MAAALPRSIPRRLALLAGAAGLFLACDSKPQSATGIPEIFMAERADAHTVWRGVWYVPRNALYDFRLEGVPRTTWRIDGRVAGARLDESPASTRTLWLTRGFHDVSIEAAATGAAPTLLIAPAGEMLHGFGDERLFGVMPRPAFVWAGLERARWLAARLLPFVLALFIVMAAAAAVERWKRRVTSEAAFASTGLPRWRRLTAGATLPIAILAVAALIRLDAITQTYGPVSSPAWLGAAQHSMRSLGRRVLPASIAWEPAPDWPHRDGPPTKYASDPYTYLRFAREMTSFYGAHYREPVFPAVTRLWLRVVANQDVAVSFASATFSVLTVWATFALGALVWSRTVGAAGAIALALEPDAITWGIGGWRDDAFACAVVVCAWGMVRLLRSGAMIDAILLGVAGGLACLVRITAVSFLLPGMLMLFVVLPQPWRRRARVLGSAGLLAAAVVGPYAINCWREFGDPLYAINYHTSNYLAAEGQPVATTSATSYVGDRLARRPFGTLDTLAIGLTAYPFSNKWTGFDRWARGSGFWISALAIAGLLGWLTTTAGRLLLVVLVSSLLPFAATWQLAADWRFTAHAYPFFLLAAASAAAAILRWTTPERLRSAPIRIRSLSSRAAMAAAIACVVIGAAAAIVWRVLPALAVQEALAAGEDVTVPSSGRASALVGNGWSPPFGAGTVISRVALESHADVWLPLPRQQDYVLALRIDPFPRPVSAGAGGLPLVRVLLNDLQVGDVRLTWNPDRVGSHDIRLTSDMVRRGLNRLTLVVEPAAHDVPAISLWYVRIRPPAPGAQAARQH